MRGAFREPGSFCGLRLGAQKDEVEKVLPFTSYLDNEGARCTAGSATLDFGGVPIRLSLTFERAYGLQRIDGGFLQQHYPSIKAVFLDALGAPDELAILEPSVVFVFEEIGVSGDYASPVDSLLWYKKSNFVSLQDRTTGMAVGHLRFATYRAMKENGAWMMGERARQALVAAGELSVPPHDWPQEPQQFESLRFGMTVAEAQQVIEFGERIPCGGRSFAACVVLIVASVAAAGRLDFTEDRLTQISGNFDVTAWPTMKATFVERYGSPHYLLEQAATEEGRFEEVHWFSDWIHIGLTGSPDGYGVGAFSLAPAWPMHADKLRAETVSIPGERTRYLRS